MKLELRISGGGTAKAVSANAAVVRLGRDRECEVPFDEKQFPKVSGLHAQLESTAGGLIVRHLSRSNATLLNGTAVDGIANVKRGDVLRLGFTGPEITIAQIVSLGNEPTPVATQPASTTTSQAKNPAILWTVLGVGVVALLVAAIAMRRDNAGASASNQPTNIEQPIEKTKAVEATPTVDPKAAMKDRFKEAVVSIGFEVDGVFRIVGSGLLVSSDRVATTATIAQFTTAAIKEATKNKKAFEGKQISPAIRLATGQIRIRKFLIDPKFDAVREHETLLDNLAVGLLERSTSKSVWRDDEECVAAIGAKSDPKPQIVDVFAWEGKGENVFEHARKEWNNVKVIGGDPGPSGEFLAFHLDETLTGSAAGGPVFIDGAWRGLLIRHPSPNDPSKRIWKFVPIDRFAMLLNQARTES